MLSVIILLCINYIKIFRFKIQHFHYFKALNSYVICSDKGRIFLIDEPHVYLHPNSEKALAKFLKQHDEHYYIIATHSPLLVSKLVPDKSYLVTRSKEGTKMSEIFNTSQNRKDVFYELGIEPKDIVLFEELIFVEGQSDKSIYETILDKLKLSGLSKNAQVVGISGAGNSQPIGKVLDLLDSMLNIPHVVILDGDQEDNKNRTHTKFLPYHDIEYVLLLDPEAIYKTIYSELYIEEKKGIEYTQNSQVKHEEIEEAKKRLCAQSAVKLKSLCLISIKLQQFTYTIKKTHREIKKSKIKGERDT